MQILTGQSDMTATNFEPHQHLVEQVLVALSISQVMLGCVFAEALSERALQAQDPQVHTDALLRCHDAAEDAVAAATPVSRPANVQHLT